MPITIDYIVEYALRNFPGVVDDQNWGERALFYSPGRLLPKGVYFLTFKEKDGANDNASRITAGEYRLNVGISQRAFVERFGSIPSRPPAGATVSTGHDFGASNVITPHPVYGWMAWIAVKNPEMETFADIEPLLMEAYRLAIVKFDRRMGTSGHKRD